MHMVVIVLLFIIAVILAVYAPWDMKGWFLFFVAMSAVFLLYGAILIPIKSDRYPDRVKLCKEIFNRLGALSAFVAIAINLICDDKIGSMGLSGVIISMLICVIIIKVYLKRT